MNATVMGVTVKINNMFGDPEFPYMVVRRDEQTAELWWYGSYDTEDRANEVAVKIRDGIVLKR